MARLFSSAKIVSTVFGPSNFERTVPRTVSAWGYNNAGAFGQIAGDVLGASTSYRGWEFNFSGSGAGISFMLLNAYPGNYLQVLSTTGPANATWCHVLVTYDGSSTAGGVKLYLNGAVLSTTTLGPGISATTVSAAQPLVMGARGDGTGALAGRLSDVAIWRRVLTLPEITTLASGIHPPDVAPDFNSYHTMDETSGPIVDYGPFGQHGVLTSTSYTNNPPRLEQRRHPVSLLPLMSPTIGPSFIPAWVIDVNLGVIGTSVY